VVKALTNELATADEEAIFGSLALADPMVLRAVVHLLTGDESLANITTETRPFLMTIETSVADPDDASMLRRKALDALLSYREGDASSQALTPARLRAAMELAVGMPIPEEELDIWLEELALEEMPRRVEWPDRPLEKVAEFEVVVIGTGLHGLNAAVQLEQTGFNFTVLEKNDGVGGTWFQNRYPGARVDVPSRIYSHSYEVDYDWEHQFAPQEENLRYLEHVAEKYNVNDRIRFGCEVVGAEWSEEAQLWNISVRRRDGSTEVVQANAIISAVGLYDKPSWPAIDGLESFSGPVVHTAAWDEALDLREKRVAIIGTGASGAQIAPALVGRAGKVTVFQRSPKWLMPVQGYQDPLPDAIRWLNRNVPYYVNFFRFRMEWFAGDHCLYNAYDIDPEWKDELSVNAQTYALKERLLEHMMSKIGDRPDLIEKCTPRFPPMARRLIADNGWFDALRRGDIELVTDDISAVTPDGVRVATGEIYEADVIVLASGFKTNDFLWPIDLVGRNGTHIRDLWATDGARAYLGMTVPAFPNFFMLYGPNKFPKVLPPPAYAELDTRYVILCLRGIIENDWQSIDIRREAYDRFNAQLDERMRTAVWFDPRQKSYFINEFGRSAVMCPWKFCEYASWTRQPDFDDYLVGSALLAG
jgi:4-hydroxyacetophenone monooxygenase